MQGRLGPKLSNKVRGVVGNRTKRFLITQTCGGGDFCMFSSRISRFCTIMQKSHLKNCLLTKNIINIWGAWKNFERTLKLKFFSEHFFISKSIRKRKRKRHTMFQLYFKIQNVRLSWFSEYGIPSDIYWILTTLDPFKNSCEWTSRSSLRRC